MTEELVVRATPDKEANYEVSKPGHDGFVAFTHRDEMFKYLNVKLVHPEPDQEVVIEEDDPGIIQDALDEASEESDETYHNDHGA